MILRSRKFTLFLLVFMFIGTLAFGQPGDPGGDPDENPVPITGIEFLIGAGMLFGAKKILSSRNKSKE